MLNNLTRFLGIELQKGFCLDELGHVFNYLIDFRRLLIAFIFAVPVPVPGAVALLGPISY